MKSKKILTILLSLAIMFTFMPAMAFATTTTSSGVQWNDDFSTATEPGVGGYGIDREFIASSGLTHAWAVKEDNTVVEDSDVWYYDFTNAEIRMTGPMYNGYYRYLEGENAVVVLKDNTGKTTSKKEVTSENAYDDEYVGTTRMVGWDVTFDVDEDLENPADTNANIDVVVESSVIGITRDGSSPENPGKVGTPVATKSVKVWGTESAADFFYEINTKGKKVPALENWTYTDPDTGETETVYEQIYDGKEHQVLIDNLEGHALSVQKYDEKAGKWVTTATPITWKNAGEVGEYRAVYTPATPDMIAYYETQGGSTAWPVRTFSVDVQGSGITPTYNWTMGNSKTRVNDAVGGDFYYDLTKEQSVDPASFVELKGALNDEDAAEIKTVYDELIAVTVSTNKVDSNIQTWTIAPKAATVQAHDNALEEVRKAHKQLFKNYDMWFFGEDADGDALVAKTARVAVAEAADVNTKEDDITFTGVTKKVYKAKKSTKKLAKTKSFKAVAKADSGNAITFSATKTNSKIKINAKTGKITVKKGLKKGTYKITVKAKTAAGNGYKAAKATKTYTIKVK